MKTKIDETKAKETWDSSSALQQEFGDFERFRAYVQAMLSGKFTAQNHENRGVTSQRNSERRDN